MSSVPKYTTDASANELDKVAVDRRPGVAVESIDQAEEKTSIRVDLLLVLLGFVAGAAAIWTMGDPSIFRFFRF